MKDHYPMSKEEYREALAELEISQGRAAWIFGGKTSKSGWRWAATGAPYCVAVLIAVMRKYKISPNQVEKIGARFRRDSDET